MNERNRQEDKWEKIVELCEEGHYLSEEELEQWSNDPEALDVCKELLRCKNAVERRLEKCSFLQKDGYFTSHGESPFSMGNHDGRGGFVSDCFSLYMV